MAEEEIKATDESFEFDKFDEEDPDVPADLFTMWGKSNVPEDDSEEEESAESVEESDTVAEIEVDELATETEEIGDEPTIAEAEEPAVVEASAEPIIMEETEDAPAPTDDEVQASDEAPAPAIDVATDTIEPSATTTELADTIDVAADTIEPPATTTELADTINVATDTTEAVATTTEFADTVEAPTDTIEFADATESTDITDDDLDDLIDVPILPLPVESTEVTDDDLDDIRVPILSPGDPITIPSLTVQTAPDEQPTELSSPSLVEMVQEQDAVDALGDLTAPASDDSLAMFKTLRDLAEELPHNVYDAFKASKMSAKLDEIIEKLETEQ